MANDILGAFLTGQQAGQQQRTRRTLADFLQPALGGDKDALSKVYAADPDAGMQVQGMAQRQQAADHDQKMEQLELVSRAWRASPEMRQQLYPSVVELTESVMPQFAGKIPREYSPQYEANIDKFLSGFAGQEEQFTLSPGSARYGADGRLLVQQPFAPAKPEFVLSPDGTQWLPKPTGAPAPQSGGFGIAETDNYVRNIMGNVGQIDPNASPEQIADQILPHLIKQESGGDPSAVSPKGAQGLTQVMPATGRDPGFGVAPLRDGSPQENVRFGREYLTAMLKRYPGRPDLALAAYNAGPGVADRFAQPQASNGGAIPIPGARPRESEETYSQPQVVTNPQTGKQELVQFGNRGGRRVVTDYTPGPTDRDAKPPTEGERKAATLLSRLEFSENQLREAVKADKSAASPSVAASVASAIPFVGEQARNFANSSERQRVEAAQLDILDAALTLGTGAAYTREQLEGYRKSYFPQIGDSQATIDDKAARLQNVIDSARIAAGRAAPGAAPSNSPSPGSSSNGWSIKVKP
jgi:hypothetical protein